MKGKTISKNDQCDQPKDTLWLLEKICHTSTSGPRVGGDVTVEHLPPPLATAFLQVVWCSQCPNIPTFLNPFPGSHLQFIDIYLILSSKKSLHGVAKLVSFRSNFKGIRSNKLNQLFLSGIFLQMPTKQLQGR